MVKKYNDRIADAVPAFMEALAKIGGVTLTTAGWQSDQKLCGHADDFSLSIDRYMRAPTNAPHFDMDLAHAKIAEAIRAANTTLGEVIRPHIIKSHLMLDVKPRALASLTDFFDHYARARHNPDSNMGASASATATFRGRT